MLDHLGVQAADVEAALSFYLRAFAPIGMREIMRYETPGGPVVGLGGADGMPTFWLSSGNSSETRELHVAFRAPDRAAVDAVHEAAVAMDAEVLHAPRVFPEYHPTYYGVFLRDLDGYNVEAVHHGF
jgi:catechol 2,3-dioxygenase-like lactoylglutathione lyase family enzyme